MALALRSVGIPSRFVTGFLGGEIGAFGRYVLVRGANVHAWVEAWCGPEKGWLTFDPTPQVGQPKLERVPLTSRLRQVTDGIEFFYDRFVLSFGQSDQAEMLRRIREAAGGVAAALRGVGALLGEPLARVTGGRAWAGAAALAAPRRPRRARAEDASSPARASGRAACRRPRPRTAASRRRSTGAARRSRRRPRPPRRSRRRRSSAPRRRRQPPPSSAPT